MSDPSRQAVFTTGPTMRHVIVMTATGSVGLVAIFVVDALNLFYISLLGHQALAAAIGYAGTLLFFTLSVSIGLTVATTAVVARALGAKDRDKAARRAGAALLFVIVCNCTLTALMWPFLHELVYLLGARGETLEIATGFLQIIVLSAPIMAIGMCFTGILRAQGDARRAMYVTLAGGMAAAVLDPLFIFGLNLGITGAAIATVLSRLVLLAVGFHGAHVVHRLVQFPTRQAVLDAAKPFAAIAVPAIMTQLATPFSNAFVTGKMAEFGDEAVAGWAIIGRLIPVVFGAIFSLSGAIGPIISQNLGAGLNDRIKQAMRDALVFITLYILVTWALLFLFAEPIAGLFDAEGEARSLVVFFCQIVAGSFLFAGALFVANAAFNNLGSAFYSTIFNWGRSTLGTVPFVWFGAQYAGATGALAGWGLGAVVFGIAAMVVCFRVIDRLPDQPPDDGDGAPYAPRSRLSPFSSGKASTAG